MMHSLETLIGQHDALEKLAADLCRMIADPRPDIPHILAVRTRLSMLLAMHLRGEDNLIYPALAGAADCQKTVADFTEEFASLSADWKAYLEEWGDDCVEQDWIDFCIETERMMARLLARIERENACLYPLAFRKGRIPLRMRKAQ